MSNETAIEQTSNETMSEEAVTDDASSNGADESSSEEVAADTPKFIYKDFTEERIEEALKKAAQLDVIAEDSEFPSYYRSMLSRALGFEDKQPSSKKEEPASDDNEYVDLDDRELMKKYVSSTVRNELKAELQSFLGQLAPLMEEVTAKKKAELTKDFGDFEAMMPKIAEYRRKHPWAASAPAEHVARIVDYDSAKERSKKQAIDGLRQKPTSLKPRSSPEAPKTHDLRGKSPLEIMQAVKAEMRKRGELVDDES